MCYAILRIKYKTGDGPTMLDVNSETELGTRLAALKDAVGVASISVYQRTATHNRIETWVEETPA